jgi:hypothetical protein
MRKNSSFLGDFSFTFWPFLRYNIDEKYACQVVQKIDWHSRIFFPIFTPF